MTTAQEYGSNKEKWRQFSVTQLAFDLYDHFKRPTLIRLFPYIWDHAADHLASLAFGVVGALLVELAKQIFKLNFP